MSEPIKHHYHKKLLKLYEQGKIPSASLGLMDIYHDDWCALYRDAYCNCDPDIQLCFPSGGNGPDNGQAQEKAGSADKENLRKGIR